MTAAAAHFLSCDWGTSAFRLHLVDAASGDSIAAISAPDGINAVHSAWKAAGAGADRDDYFLKVLRSQVTALATVAGRRLDGLRILISGMVTASIGLREIPHHAMPFSLGGRDLRVERLTPAPVGLGPVLLVSGARTAEDVMRGEEIQVVGAAMLGAPASGLFILPGTHSKHVLVEACRAVDLRTYMTGEFFELLARRSILANSVEDAGGAADDPAFAEGVVRGAAENLLHASFGVRAAELSGRRNRAASWQFLSGLVIGAELRELRDTAVRAIALVGSPALTERYAAALQVLDHPGHVEIFRGEAAVIAGHCVLLARQ